MLSELLGGNYRGMHNVGPQLARLRREKKSDKFRNLVANRKIIVEKDKK